MTAYRRIGQGLLASIFIYGGVDAIRNPKPKVPPAEPVGPPIAAWVLETQGWNGFGWLLSAIAVFGIVCLAPLAVGALRRTA